MRGGFTGGLEPSTLTFLMSRVARLPMSSPAGGAEVFSCSWRQTTPKRSARNV